MSAARGALRRRVLARLLDRAPGSGWTEAALRGAAGDAGLAPAEAALLFPGGVAEALAFHAAEADRAMAARMRRRNLAGRGVRDRVETALRVRLEALAGRHAAVRRAAAAWAVRPAALLRAAWATSDAAWRAAGDASTDSSYYTRRAQLAAVHLATLLAWAGDPEGDLDRARAFLARRLDGVAAFGRRAAAARRRLAGAAPAGRILGLLGRLRFPPAPGGGAAP